MLMTARLLLFVPCGLLAFFGPKLGGTLSAADPKPKPPNIIIFLPDDQGYADVGFQGCKDIPTPNIDTLARNGVKCTSGYVSCPYCSPTRAGLLTGRYQQRFGHEFNPAPHEAGNYGLPVEEKTIADRLKKAGYVTGIVGKWHLGTAPQFHPLKRGFDEFYGFLGGAHSYFPDRPGKNDTPILRGYQKVKETEYLTDALAREAVAFIDRHKAKPFFLYLSFNAVHTPMHAKEEHLKRKDIAKIKDVNRRTYAAMSVAMDEAIGRVLDKLRAEKLEENTLIFYFSDNGGATLPRSAENFSRNDPLRGGKWTTLEGGIRVPFVVQWKGTLPAGKVYDHPVIQLDVLPTALAVAGVKVDPEWKLDGVNLIPYLSGNKSGPPHEALYWRLGKQYAIRKGDWKWVGYHPVADKEAGRLSIDAVKPPRLYNLKDDIGEQKDLSAQNRKKAAELEALWMKWNKELKAPLWKHDSGGKTPLQK